jgi:INO80 complex subunit C
MPPSTPQASDKDDSHQILLDQMDIYYVPKPFRNPNWKPSGRRNKNTKQIISESQRKEASVLATQNNSGASTPLPNADTGANTDGAMTPAITSSAQASRPVNMEKATQSLSAMVLERNLHRSSNYLPPATLGANLPGTGLGGPAVTYTNIESAPSLHPANHRHYCDITGLPSRYTDPKTKLRYYDKEIFAVVRTLPPGASDQYLAARAANVVLK